ncbi:hypothetical protein NHF48_005050 [Sphingomonas sp. H160509]|uniref:hypothetical protein n=1 Tax=Sphingomonas sp. H160509 TaxID=2955313 RepID=UPI002096C2DE|nr:hypothetical protein [Sphingomonas sp. H160509]MDD1450501.1 hypothetical protein [Sphingomonas sp. H160509]
MRDHADECAERDLYERTWQRRRQHARRDAAHHDGEQQEQAQGHNLQTGLPKVLDAQQARRRAINRTGR